MIRVLLADDNAGFRRALRRLFERESDITIVGEADDGAKAVAQGLALTPDVVVMDLVMPGLNGLAATSDLRRARPGIAVLLLSIGDAGSPSAAGEAGANAHLLKSAPATEIVATVRRLCAAV